MNCWLNLYKPKGISSAKAVALVKRVFRGSKIGHCGTLDLEAEGVLPLAIGQATKLVSILMDARKQYIFTVQFGARTDSGDAAGNVIASTEYLPSKAEILAICQSFIGQIEQIPPAFSALKVNGQRSYKLAREGRAVELPRRIITIYDLKCLEIDPKNAQATFVADCSKGTYIRTLAEDISFSLQSLGFVIELRRTKVGIFTEENSVNIEDYMGADLQEAAKALKVKCLKIEDVLDGIPVLEADESVARKISFGQKVSFDLDQNYDLVWVRHDGRIIAIGSLQDNSFNSSRVFNYNNGDHDVDYE